MIRVGSRLLALAGGVLLGATLSSMPASAATTSPLSADVTVTSDDTATVSDVRWELPADAAPGDVVTLALAALVALTSAQIFLRTSGPARKAAAPALAAALATAIAR